MSSCAEWPTLSAALDARSRRVFAGEGIDAADIVTSGQAAVMADGRQTPAAASEQQRGLRQDRRGGGGAFSAADCMAMLMSVAGAVSGVACGIRVGVERTRGGASLRLAMSSWPAVNGPAARRSCQPPAR